MSAQNPTDPAFSSPTIPPEAAIMAADPAAPADALAALLALPAHGAFSPDQRDLLIRLDRLQRQKRYHEDAAEALVKPVRELADRALTMLIELGMVEDIDPFDGGDGFDLRPYLSERVWPKYRNDPDGAKYKVADVVAALRACGHGKLVTDRPDANPYNKLVSNYVKAWRARVDETAGKGIRNGDGLLVDAFGNVLTEAEAGKPTADALGLPPALRAVIEPVTLRHVLFTRTRQASPAVEDLTEREDAALDAAAADGQDIAESA